ncbi:MAG: Zn-ribbon domain-containing OB-fold protein [Acidimicrobiales bacterium]|nr:Zn-ribbon domain-containing OB-fold protein [Acidimicrobiales bacterium]
MSDLPTFAPPVTPETKPFWDATAEGRLVLPRCTSCQTVIWYPRTFCPECHTEGVEWIDATGEGTVYSYTVTHKGDGPWRDESPYVMAYVELDEGPRVLTNIVDCDPAKVSIGQRVSVRWAPTDEGPAVPRFAPAP